MSEIGFLKSISVETTPDTSPGLIHHMLTFTFDSGKMLRTVLPPLAAPEYIAETLRQLAMQLDERGGQ